MKIKIIINTSLKSPKYIFYSFKNDSMTFVVHKLNIAFVLDLDDLTIKTIFKNSRGKAYFDNIQKGKNSDKIMLYNKNEKECWASIATSPSRVNGIVNKNKLIVNAQNEENIQIKSTNDIDGISPQLYKALNPDADIPASLINNYNQDKNRQYNTLTDSKQIIKEIKNTLTNKGDVSNLYKLKWNQMLDNLSFKALRAEASSEKKATSSSLGSISQNDTGRLVGPQELSANSLKGRDEVSNNRLVGVITNRLSTNDTSSSNNNVTQKNN